MHWELFFFFLCISLVYSIVGFGGRNSYIALLGFYAIPIKEMYFIALLCNIIVVSVCAFVFLKKYQLDWKRVFPIVILSIPFSFLGAGIKVAHSNLFLILGVNLLIVGVALWIKSKGRQVYMVAKTDKYTYLKDAFIGAYIGFLSSMLGIGGGIFLAPLLNFRKWDNPKKIATIAALFILANSICSFSIILYDLPKDINYIRLASLCIAVFVGGQIGSRLGVYKLSVMVIRRLTALIVVITGLEVLSHHLPIMQ